VSKPAAADRESGPPCRYHIAPLRRPAYLWSPDGGGRDQVRLQEIP